MHPFVALELAAAAIREGPQDSYETWEALRDLRGGGLTYETAAGLWRALGTDARGYNGRMIGATQTINALLNRSARELRTKRLDPLELAAARVSDG